MTSAAVSLVVVSCVFGGSILAMYAARALPDSHLSADARDVIKLGMALIATLVALVLGLMIATAKGTYDAQSAAVRQLSANVLLLDRSLAEYGPEAQHLRDLLRQAAELMLERLWPADGSASVSLAPGEARSQMSEFLREVTRLSPQNETQQFLKTQALRIMSCTRFSWTRHCRDGNREEQSDGSNGRCGCGGWGCGQRGRAALVRAVHSPR